MKPRSAFSIAVPLLTTLLCSLAPIPSNVFGQTFNFENGNTSQLSWVYLPQHVSVVPSTLPGGGNYAFRCMIPQGASQTYCGFAIDLHDFPLVSPQVSDIYIRYYVKFEPSWRFATENIYFKSQIIEVNAVNYNAGGRSFINFNARNETTAEILFLTYSDNGSWRSTGTTIRNDGQWHCIESRHLRNLADPPQGRFQYWFDGQLMLNIFPINMGNATPASLTFGFRNGAAQQDMYMQYDEIIIADHYIGPIGSAPDGTPPAPPQNLRVQ